ncbi:T9SS type A sorting domain-containing protein [Aquimarina aggregata]|uniref:T9SS type A sorting domain-containing protein n=1 Tax=Aquimarina aggregata TaxID=1642818 RepID=UPI00248F5175|nr:T9SS type A sorting domain-containing protein [Aquimarina aggregata]
MNNLYPKLLLLTFLLVSYSIFAQTVNVSIDLEKQRFLGEESNLDRSKYFNLHNASEEPAFPTFLKDNNFGFGRRFFDPHSDRSFVNPIGNYPTTPATSDGIVRPVRRFIATSNPASSWTADSDPTTGAISAARYFVDVVDTNNRPEYWEPFNEPFIKANNFINAAAPTGQDVVRKMSEWFRDMARGIHNTPELAKMKVIGFSSAFPSYARRDFSETWQNHMKLFIDVAGADIDALSVHPYDGVNQIGQSNGRSGSNSEAILDLLEAYTDEVLGEPKKLAITEFGVIERDFPLGPAPGFYNESAAAITINGLNSMLFNFFERQDNIEICIPFITGRADFFYNDFNADGGDGTPQPYVPAYLRPTEVLSVRDPNTGLFRNDEFVLTFKENFFKFWKDVKGDRARITSDNLDVQVQAFVDGNTAYVALNNLDSADKVVNLNFLNTTGTVTNVSTSFLVINGQNTPIYEPGTDSNTLPSSVTLKVGETRMLKITYDTAIQFTSSIIRKKYYGTSTQASVDKAPTVIITANDPKTFIIDGVVKGTSGDATLRLGVGIPITTGVGSTTPTNLDRLPSEVTFNGTTLTIPSNWKGNDQTGRADFFGVLELDVPHNIISDGNNTVTVRYTQAGGRIASVVLSLETEEGPCTETTLYADEDGDGLGDPNVTIQSCGPVNGFVDNSDDRCLNDIENVCLAIDIPGIVQAEEFVVNNGTNVNGTIIDSVNNGDSSTYDVDVSVPGSFDVTVRASTPAGGGGTVKIFSGTNELTTITITDTGGVTTFQDFTGTITLDKRGLSKLRFEYSGAAGELFNIDSFEFTSNEAFVVLTNPESDEIALIITNTQTSFSIDVEYATLKSSQTVDFNLRAGTTGVTGGFASIRPGAPTTAAGTFNITLSGPLPVGDYEVPIFINSPGDDPQFIGGPDPTLKLRVIEPNIDAVDDTSENNPRGTTISLNILTNDKKEDGSTPIASEVTVDLDTTSTGQQTELIVANEGTWSYNATNGIVSFVPLSGFTANPTDITYSLTEIANSLSDEATINFEYIQPPAINNDSSTDNNPGVVSISILNNDTTSNGTTLNPSGVTVDLDPSTTTVENTLSAGVLGDWAYNESSGVLTFTPNTQFSANPPAITYQVTETATSLSGTGTVTITYREFTLAEFTVKSIGETCASENNGIIEISALANGAYSYQINSAASINFTKDISIENLDAGTYNLVITDTNSQDTFNFEIVISEPENLKASTRVFQTAKQVILDLSGSNEFKINLNGNEFTTTENSLTLSLKDGVNNLQVQGEKECQGKFDQKIIIGDAIIAYPNPVVDNLTIETNTSGTTNIEIFDIAGKLVISKSSTSTNGISQVNLQDLTSGMYFVIVNTSNSSKTLKITK